MNHIITFLFSVLCITSQIIPATVTPQCKPIDEQSVECALEFTLEPNEFVYKDSLLLSVDDPAIELSAWRSSLQAVEKYIPSLRSSHALFTKDFSVRVTATKKSSPSPSAALYLSYQSNNKRTPTEEVIPLNFFEQEPPPASSLCEPLSPQAVAQPLRQGSYLSLNAWSQYIENLVRTTDLLIVQILLVALLGLLMSFTPCIYPMIPITIGIMQGQANPSVLTNFLHAFSYSIGIATTFALLGLLAALSGAIFGMLLTSPLVVLLIVSMLVYLALSMFGFYEMRIPSFLQTHSHTHKASFISSFIFGALSGTVASPCLSPGLALVLCIVASLGSAFLGFLLLFSFGIGLSIPLLIIGTFSSSLNVLPRAGYWMIEVKKIFGFLLLGMSFYYLKNILPTSLVLWLMSLFCLGAGIYYILSGSESDTTWVRRFKIVFGILFLTSALHLAFHAYEQRYEKEQAVETFWITSYPAALEKARAEEKMLFIDFWAPSCSICTAIDKKLLRDPEVRTALSRFIPTKLELVMTDQTIMKLKDQFAIIGLPTFMVVDPVREEVIKRWGSELYRADKQTFIKELESLKN